MSRSKLLILPGEPSQREQIPTNLLVQPTALIGRERELEAVRRLLEGHEGSGAVRLLTLVGLGGVGKTRLALQVAEDELQRFPDGVYFVELAAITDPDLVIPAIARTLDIREAPGVPLLSSLKEHLHNKQMLLVLDNFEQVTSAGTLAADLLTACLYLKLLVTSRSPLHLHAEQEFPVSALALPEPDDRLSVGKLSEYGAVALFLQRARMVKPDFDFKNSNAGAVVEVCRRVDGLPLAIELVAAHIRLLSPQSILARLTHPLDMLKLGVQDFPVRHQTMRDTIGWSYHLLTEQQQRLFRHLSVFSGGFAIRAAEDICNEPRDISTETDHPHAIAVLTGLEALIDKSLLCRLEQGEVEEPRLTMLETVREYAREKLQQTGEEAALQARHALYFMRLAEEAEPHLTGSTQKEWLARLEGEYDNIRTALRWATEAKRNADEATEAIEIGLRTAGAMWRSWLVKGYFTEGREEIQRLVTGAALRDTSREGRAKALNGAGVIAFRQADYTSARLLAEDALILSREVGDTSSISDALNTMGSAAFGQGDYVAARYHFEQSLVLKRELDEKVGVSNALGNLGVIAYTQGEYANARSLLEQNLALKRALGDRVGVAMALNNLGLVAYMERSYSVACSLYEESLALRNELGDKWGRAISLNNLGLVAYMEGDYPTAYILCAESLALKRELGDKGGIATSLAALGEIAVASGQPQVGSRLLGASDALVESIGAAVEPGIRISYELGVASARAQLGAEAFEQAKQDGRTMALEEAFELASHPFDKVVGPQTKQSTYPGGLTSREAETTLLVAQGLSNEDIARKLVLSERTVEMHVSHALHKLGLSSRVQLAAWAILNGLAPSEHPKHE